MDRGTLGRSMKLSATITIPRTQADVFAFVSDVTNMPKWVTGVVSARLVSPDVALGSRFIVEYRQSRRPDEVELEVAKYDPPESFAIRSSNAPFQFEGSVHLEEVAGGTQVTNTIEAGPDSLSTKLVTMLFGPLLRRSMRKRLLRELNDLEFAVTG